MFVHMDTHLCEYTRVQGSVEAEPNPRHHSSGSDRVLTGLQLSAWAGLPGQQGLVCLSPPPQCWESRSIGTYPWLS